MWPDYNPEQPTYTLRERETQPYRCGLISLVLPLLLSLSLFRFPVSFCMHVRLISCTTRRMSNDTKIKERNCVNARLVAASKIN